MMWGVWVLLQASHEVFAAGDKRTEINDKKDYLIINANHQASYDVSAAGDKRNEINGQKRLINH